MKKTIKRYSDSELLHMTEKKLHTLLNSDRIDDDDFQRWYDLQDEVQQIAESFIRDELQYWIDSNN